MWYQDRSPDCFVHYIIVQTAIFIEQIDINGKISTNYRPLGEGVNSSNIKIYW